MYAVAEFVLFMRLLTLLEITRSIGPMLIALKYLLKDVLKFSVILLTTVVGTSITIYSMNVRLTTILSNVHNLCLLVNRESGGSEDAKEIFQELSYNSTKVCAGAEEGVFEAPPSFENFAATITSVMWSTFGLFDVKVCKSR